MSNLSYRLSGTFFELCDCSSICPCWIGLPPDEGRCTGAFGWSIAEGTINGQDMGGRSVVSVSFHSGHRDGGGQQVHIFVDDGADDQQFGTLVATFTGQNGGPLGELGHLMGALISQDRAPITMTSQGDYISVTVGRLIRGDATVIYGGDKQITELAHGTLSEVLGTPAEVGRSSAFRVDAMVGLSVEVSGRAAMRGKFRYENEGDPA